MVNILTIDMPEPIIECVTSHTLYECYHDYIMLVVVHQNYYMLCFFIGTLYVMFQNLENS